jgi:hypothetical protein
MTSACIHCYINYWPTCPCATQIPQDRKYTKPIFTRENLKIAEHTETLKASSRKAFSTFEVAMKSLQVNNSDKVDCTMVS